MVNTFVKSAVSVSAVVFVSVLPSVPASAAGPIPGLFNTGVDDSGAPLPLGVRDPHYTVLETDDSAFTINRIPGNFIPNGPDSFWISDNPNGLPFTNPTTRTFRTTFDLTGKDPTTAFISGLWAADDKGLDILINGVSTGQMVLGFNSFSSFSISSGFVAGENTLDFVVEDLGRVISGLRVAEISGTAEHLTPTPVPEPTSTLGFLALATLGAASIVKRKLKPFKSPEEETEQVG